MEVLHFEDGRTPRPLDPARPLPQGGFVWLDVDRAGDAEWRATVERLAGITLYEQHYRDLENVQHPSHYDGTADYEVLLFRSLAPEQGGEAFPTRCLGLLLTPRVLVTVHEPDSVSIATVRERVASGTGRIPLRPVGLMHLILNTVVDRFLARRDPLAGQLAEWREALLDPKNPFDDWLALLQFGSQLRQLATLCEEQSDALGRWEEDTGTEIDEFLAVRLRDLHEHIERVRSFAAGRQADSESLVQLHFSAVAHRTNEIMRVLTVVSAIFLPLSLVAGIFGMNFEYMPELKWPGAYFVALTGMASLGLGLLALFRRKHWV
ncbi:MAG: magnesium transporter CorA family protein [Gammaproteobacteria bacterium]|nr:magnesium transporter CorA family protein [Gammaproteobacteria bacterium]